MIIPHSAPTLSFQDRQSVEKVLTTPYIAQEKKVQEFEEAFSRYLNVKGSVAVSSGTAALHLALLTLGVKKGDEVIFPSYVCTALLNAVLYVGATPCLVDVNEDDFNISLVDVKRKINRRTKAIIVPHMFGLPADLNPLIKIGIPLIEDCAQSIGAEYQRKKVGSLGQISICSFYATKVLTTGEGGMIFSNHQKYLDRARNLRQYDHVSKFQLRFNYKLTDFQAALGLSQLKQLPQFISRRQAMAKQYQEAFRNLDIILPQGFSGREHIFYRYVIRVKDSAKKVIDTLRRKGVDASAPVFKPIHVYLNKKGFPVSQKLFETSVSIPLYPAMSGQDVKRIISVIRERL